MNSSVVYDESNLPFASNPDHRCPTILVLDSSYSMSSHGRIDKLNDGIKRLIGDINDDVLARRRIDLAIIKVSNSMPELIQPMVTVQNIVGSNQIKFEASGGTPMCSALTLGLKVLDEHKKVLRENGIQYYKSMMFVLSDGEFSVSNQTLSNLHESEERNGHVIFPVGVGNNANVDDLASLSSKGRAFLLDDTSFADLFEFMSNSLSSVSVSSPGDKLSVEIPATMMVVERKKVDL